VSSGDEARGLVDHVLVMSVYRGFGGERCSANALKKVRALSWKRRELGLELSIEIDGGISLDNVGDAVRAGCDWIVTGSSIFHTADPEATFREMQRTAREAALVRV